MTQSSIGQDYYRLHPEKLLISFLSGPVYDLVREWELKGDIKYTLKSTIQDSIDTLELSIPLKKFLITSNRYRNVCDVLINGGTVISVGFELEAEIRDRCGFCCPKSLAGYQYYRGFTDNAHRPGILCQNIAALDYPRGNAHPTLPNKKKVSLPPGSYLVDAEVFNEVLNRETLYAVLPYR